MAFSVVRVDSFCAWRQHRIVASLPCTEDSVHPLSSRFVKQTLKPATGHCIKVEGKIMGALAASVRTRHQHHLRLIRSRETTDERMSLRWCWWRVRTEAA